MREQGTLLKNVTTIRVILISFEMQNLSHPFSLVYRVVVFVVV